MNPRSLVLLALSALVLPVAVSATTILIDFGGTPTPVVNGTHWNNVNFNTGSTEPDLPITLVNSAGVDSAALVFAVRYPGTNAVGPTGDGTYKGLPGTASQDSLYAEAAGNPKFTISGLDAGATYKFTIFASRTGATDVRTGVYTVTGSTADVGILNASNNTTTALELTVSASAAGTVVFEMKAFINPGDPNSNTNGAKYTYLNALMIESA